MPACCEVHPVQAGGHVALGCASEKKKFKIISITQSKKNITYTNFFKMHTESTFYTFSNIKEIMINLKAVPPASRGSIFGLRGVWFLA